MPLIYQHSINSTTLVGLWHITEDESFFLTRVPLPQKVSHPHKRLQHLAGRYLLTALCPNFPLCELMVADTKKPYLPSEQYHFSIAHSGEYAAAIVSTHQRVGIDAEIPGEKILKVKHKYMHADDIPALLQNADAYHRQQLITLCWCAKEAMFKWYGKGQIDFKQHLRIYDIHGNKIEGNIDAGFLKNTPNALSLSYRQFEDLVLCWLATDA